MTRYATLLGTGGYLPEHILTNQEISKTVDTNDEWIVERTGIRERRIAGKEESASSMAEMAARQAIEAAGLQPDDIDLIVVGTGTPDRIFPSTACLLQHRLNIRKCAAFDVQAACSGFIFALSVADQYIRAGSSRHVLVVGTELNSRLVDWTDRSTCILFGDGAGAVVLGVSDRPGIMSTHIHSDGQYQDLLYAPNPVHDATQNSPRQYLQMQGNEVFKVAVNTLGRIVDETLAEMVWINPTLIGWFRIRLISESLQPQPKNLGCLWIRLW